jgi:alcohol dehydrogenase class IV
MKKELTIQTALDALSHSLEAIWNKNANPISTNYSIRAAKEILNTLPKLDM